MRLRRGSVAMLAAAVLLAGCPSAVREPSPAPSREPEAASRLPPPGARRFDVIPQESLLTVLVYRGGPLAKAGHNHVVASHDMRGQLYVAKDVSRSMFALEVPVATLTVDERDLRAREGAEFPPEVPQSAKEGTRRNMLSEALLDGERFPTITLQSERIEETAAGLVAHVRVTVREQAYPVAVPMTYAVGTDALEASGELPLTHRQIGLTPFSAMLGALQVQDEMKVKFTIRARPASPDLTQTAARVCPNARPLTPCQI